MSNNPREGRTAIFRDDAPPRITTMRARAHQQLDVILNRVLSEGETVRGVGIAVTSRSSHGRDSSWWEGVWDDDQALIAAYDFASFAMKLKRLR